MPAHSVSAPSVISGGAGDETATLSYSGSTSATLRLVAIDTVTGQQTIVGTETFTHQGGSGGTATITFDPNTISSLPAGTYVFRVDVLQSNGGGGFSGPESGLVPICFVAGTRIATARGEVAVEALRAGDLVVVVAGGTGRLVPVIWNGTMAMRLDRLPDRSLAAPILIRAGALADGVPHRDLRVSPEHGMAIDGRLVPARLLLNGTTIVQELWRREVTYWHVELPAHGLLLAKGAASESYFDDGNRMLFDNHRIVAIMQGPDGARRSGRYAAGACLPPLTEGPALDRIRARLGARAEALAGPALRRRA